MMSRVREHVAGWRTTLANVSDHPAVRPFLPVLPVLPFPPFLPFQPFTA